MTPECCRNCGAGAVAVATVLAYVAILYGFARAIKGKRPLDTSVAPSRAAPSLLADEAAFEAALERLAAHDADFVALALGTDARPSLRRREAGFEGLAWIVVGQQVSTASAEAIFVRLKARLGTVSAATVDAAEDHDLRLCGLSGSKVRTVRALAEAVGCGKLDFAALAAAEADAAHAVLRTVKGIGPWTADVFLLFCLGHADAWPAGDLALQEAARMVLDLPERPSTEALRILGERWRPLRGVAAHCLWAYYKAARAKPAEPARPMKPRGRKRE